MTKTCPHGVTPKRKCKICQKLRRKEWHKRNKDKQKIAGRKYREKNKEKIAKEQRDYYQKHRDELLANRREYYIKNRERELARSKKYFKANHQRCMERSVIYSRERRRKLKEYFVQLLGGKCQNPNCSCPNGYSRCLSALEFHHIDPKEKESKSEYRSKEKFEKKVKEGKIILLCANCHREEHEKLKEEKNNEGKKTK